MLKLLDSQTIMWAFVCLFVVVTSYVIGEPQHPLDIGNAHHSNPETAAGLFEGDIDLDGINPFDRNAMKDPSKHWPNGVVYYTISSRYDSADTDTILEAMREIQNDTHVHGKDCITFVPRTHEPNYVEVLSGSGCHSFIGYRGGHQTSTISQGCRRKGIIMHELLHTLGFWHEHTRPDRDQYVTIEWNNVESGTEKDFSIHSSSEADTMGLPYDYNSIMHYNAYEFAKDNKKPTIIPKQAGVYIGQRIRLSTLDIKKIQILYGCLPRGSSYMPPTVGAPTVYRDACTFQRDMCDWTNLGGDKMNWVRRKGRTPSGRTGPEYDHTYSYEGYYIYMEATQHFHYTAILASKRYPPGHYCVTFYYHMLGADQGTLSLRAATSTHHTTLKRVSGNHGDMWHRVEEPYHTTGYFQFQFAGEIGSNYASDIGLDDISVHTGDCPGNGGIVG